MQRIAATMGPSAAAASATHTLAVPSEETALETRMVAGNEHTRAHAAASPTAVPKRMTNELASGGEAWKGGSDAGMTG